MLVIYYNYTIFIKRGLILKLVLFFKTFEGNSKNYRLEKLKNSIIKWTGVINLLKAIFIDIDGTLRINKRIDEKILASLEQLNNLGIKVIITTGRNFVYARNLARKLKVYPLIIACNGALVKRYDNNEIIYDSKISRKTVRKIFDFTSSHNCKLLAHEDNNNYYIRKNDDIGTGIVGLTITSNNYERMITMKYLFKDQIPEVEFVNSSKAIYLEKRIHNKIYFHDINNKNVTKGKGISEVLDYLNLNSNEVMSIGDSNNDISMTYVVDKSIAVKDSTLALQNNSTLTLTSDLGTYLSELVKKLQNNV